MTSDENKQQQYSDDQQWSTENEPPKSDNEQLFNEILEQTKEATERDSFCELVLEFGRRHAGQQDLSFELMIKLIELVLRKQYPNTQLPDGCAEWISEILYHDATSRRRIEKLWNDVMHEVS